MSENSISYRYLATKERPMIDFIEFFTIIKGYDEVDGSAIVAVAANDRKNRYGSIACKGRVGDMTGFGTG